MKPLLLDTNILSYILKGREPVLGRLESALRQERAFLLGSIVHYELSRYLDLKGAHRLLQMYERLVSPWERCDLTFDDWSAAASLWAERHRIGRSVSDFDLLLATLARSRGAVLVTGNVRHFEGLELEVEDWLMPLP